MHYALSTSIPLQPATAGRDILLFASQPDTGVAATDAFRPKTPRPQSPPSNRSESPVLVHRTASLPPAEEDASNPRNVDPERRVLPWTSTVMTDRPATVEQQPPDSPSRALLQPRSQSEMRQRDASIDSARPLLQSSSVQSSPRPRNVLLKKNSLRNRTSSSESRQHSIRPHSRQASNAGAAAMVAPSQPAAQAAPTTNDRETWTMVDPPSNVGHLGVTMYSNVDAEQQALAVSNHQTIPAPQITSIGQRPQQPGQAFDQQSVSGESVYETPSADVLLNPPPPRPQEEFNSSSIPLGKPMSSDGASIVSSIPTHLQLKAPRSPNRVNNAESVDIGIPSVYGSVGYLPSMMSQNPSMMSPDPMPAGHSRSASEALDLLMGQGGHANADIDGLPADSGVEDRKGKGKEGSRRVWDEDKSAWVDFAPSQGPTNGHGNGDGPGSARTRISMG